MAIETETATATVIVIELVIVIVTVTVVVIEIVTVTVMKMRSDDITVTTITGTMMKQIVSDADVIEMMMTMILEQRIPTTITIIDPTESVMHLLRPDET